MSESRPPRPCSLDVDPDGIPGMLKSRDQWICWGNRWKRDRKEWAKVPHDATSGGHASPTDPDTWASFEDAVAYHDRDDTDTDGLGFVFTASDDVIGVDLDDCRDPETGHPDEWAVDVVNGLDSFTEISPSGTGFHVYAMGSLPDGGNRKGNLEMYEDARYFTVTGHHVDITPLTVEARQDEIDDVHAEYIADDEPAHADMGGFTTAGASASSDLSDEELIEKAKRADNGEKFRRLWSGNTSGYKSHSEARQALANLLAFWTGGDETRMFRLFCRSGLYRDEDDRRTFKNYEIPTALEGRSDFYEPSQNTTPTASGGGGDSDGHPNPDAVAEAAGVGGPTGLKELSNGEIAYYTWQLLRPQIDLLVSIPDETLFTYNDGVWNDDGIQTLREAGSRALGPYYSKGVLRELEEQVVTTDGIPRDDLGVESGTIAVANGLLNLDTRDHRPLEPDDYAIRQLPIEYDPNADAPRWTQFIEESVEDDRHEAIQEYVGYCLHVGALPFARVLLAVGGGSNGKTTFLNVITSLLGPENTTGYALGDLVHNEYHVAQMHGAIANIDADVTGGIGYGGMFKKLTGGDRKVSARHPYGKPFDYHPTTKQLYAANEVPDTKVEDDAFFRRWLIVEFPTEYTDPDLPGPDKDPDLEDALLDELPGILNWALDGYDRLMSQGHFTNEGATEDKRRRWQSWGDSVEKFITECVTAEGEEKHRTADVYERYTAWCGQHDETPESQSTLTSQIKKLDGVRYSSDFRFNGAKARGFKGITFTADAPPPEPAAETDGDQTSLDVSQAKAVKRVQETVAELVEGNDGDPVPIDTVVTRLDGDLGSRDPEHLIENALRDGRLYQPQDGVLLSV